MQSVNALSKYANVVRTTINRQPKIFVHLEDKECLKIRLKSTFVSTDITHTLEQAKSVIEQMTDLYNETKDKYNATIKTNT